MPLTEQNFDTWYRFFRAAMHRISYGNFSMFDEYLGWEKELLLDEYLGIDYADTARQDFYEQVRCCV